MKKKRKKLKIKNLILFFLLLILILTTITIMFNFFKNKDVKNVKNKNEVIEEKKEEYEASLIMVGDALINNNLYNDANKQANYNGYNFKPYIEYIKEEVSNYDIAYYNQETILGGTNIGLSSYPSFNSPQE